MVIVYRSHTGFTKEYALLLGKAMKMPAYEAESAPLDFGAHILYMGPVEAGHIVGIRRARKRYIVDAVCAVGMSPGGQDVVENLKRGNCIHDVPVFYLQGGWAPREVGWVKRHMVELVTSPLRRSLQAKGSKRTPEEQAYLELITAGGSRVSYENLDDIRLWLKEREK